MDEEKKRIAEKWGFGMAPEKPATVSKREGCVTKVMSVFPAPKELSP